MTVEKPMKGCSTQGGMNSIKNSVRLSVFGALFFLFLTGCPEERQEPSLLFGEGAQSCVYNSDCSGGLACNRLSGTCGQCFLSSQCNAGQKCSPAGLCVPQCKEDRDCETGKCDAEGVCVNEEGEPTTDTAQQIMDWLEENGIVDEEGNIENPDVKIGNTVVVCSEEQYAGLGDPCLVYLCLQCDCYGINNYNCLDAAGNETAEYCQDRVDNFVCRDGENPWGGDDDWSTDDDSDPPWGP